MSPASISSRFFVLGIVDTVPLILAAIPFGIIYGALAYSSGLSYWGALAMSVFVFAGSAQFIAVGLVAVAASLPVILVTVFIVNLRHTLYAATLMPQVAGLSQSWRIPMAFFLTDETFATVTNRLNRSTTDIDIRWYYFGSALFMYLNWQLCTFIGLTLGEQIPDIKDWGLEVAMIVAFIGIVIPLLKTKAHWCCVIATVPMVLITYEWPHQLGLLFSSLVAILVGLGIEKVAGQQPEVCCE